MQRQQAVADQVDRRLVAGAEQQDDVGGQLLVGELAALLLGPHQLRGEVVAGLAAAQLEQLLEILCAIRLPALASSISARERGTGSSSRPPSRAADVEHLAMLLAGMPSISQMTVTGRRKAKSAIRSMWPAVDHAIDGLVDDLPGCAAACPPPGAR